MTYRKIRFQKIRIFWFIFKCEFKRSTYADSNPKLAVAYGELAELGAEAFTSIQEGSATAMMAKLDKLLEPSPRVNNDLEDILNGIGSDIPDWFKKTKR